MTTKKREEIENKYKWKLEDIYPNEELWEQEFNKALELSNQLEKFKGTLLTSAQNLLDFLKLDEEVSLLLERLYVYAKMRRDEDNRVSKYQGLTDRAMSLSVQVNAKSSFFTPEILSINESILEKFYLEVPELEHYKIALNRILRTKPHILSAEQEEILAQTGEMAESPSTTYDMLVDADLKFPQVIDDNGEKIELTQNNFITLMQSSNREVRKGAFKALYKTFGQFQNTIASTLNSNVKNNVMYAKLRKYDNTLNSALFSNNIPTSVYENLIQTIKDNLEPMYRYMDIRKKTLKLEDIHMYDIYTPLITTDSPKIPYEKSYEIMKNGLSVLGEEYIEILNRAYNEGWIDVHSSEGKSNGAYSWGPYGTHPYVLLNHKDDLNSMFTLAHEMGHAMHSYYSKSNLDYTYAHYRIFVAEVASTVNEALLMLHLLDTTEDKKMKIHLVNYFLEQFRTTVYRQTMFAEFEKIIHDKAEKGEPLTAEVFSNIYRDLNKVYYGDNTIIDEEIAMEWARIPHFYNSFYVYQYATGFSAAMALAKKIREEGKSAVDKYIDFLKSGSTKFPIDLLKDAGVDMSSPKPIENALSIFADLVKQMEELLSE